MAGPVSPSAAWRIIETYEAGLRVCDLLLRCPRLDRGYCVECHISAWNALQIVRGHLLLLWSGKCLT